MLKIDLIILTLNFLEIISYNNFQTKSLEIYTTGITRECWKEAQREHSTRYTTKHKLHREVAAMCIVAEFSDH